MAAGSSLLNPSASPNLIIDPITKEDLYLIGATPVGQGSGEVRLADLAGLPLIMPHTLHTSGREFETVKQSRQ